MIPEDGPSFDDLTTQEDGTRFFSVRVRDPDSAGMIVRGLIAVTPTQFDELRAKCVLHGYDVEEALPGVAAFEVLQRLWGETWPEGYEVTSIEEVTRDEMVRREDVRRTRSD